MSFWENIAIDNIPGEEWREVFGYEKCYKVSSFGRIKRLVGYCCLTERILKQAIICFGRLRVTLSVDKQKKQYSVHRLVAIAFIENPLNAPVVLHIDDNPKNNMVDNLKWGTQSDNIRDCHNKGRAKNNLPTPKFGKDHVNYGKEMKIETKIKMAKKKHIIPDEILLDAMEKIRQGATLAEVSRSTGLSGSYLSSLNRGKTFRSKILGI